MYIYSVYIVQMWYICSVYTVYIDIVYNIIFQKRNIYLTNADMEEIFLTRFLHNLSLSKKEKKYIVNNTLARVQVIDPVRGNDIFCTGKIADDLR